MRIIAGKARRLPLRTLPGRDTRPTTDRIKETLFNILQSEIAAIRCNMLTKPQVTGVGAVCPNSGIINGLGLTGGIAGACGNGYSGAIY